LLRVTITSISLLLLNSIATFKVLVMIEMSLTTLRLRTPSVVVVPPLNATVWPVLTSFDARQTNAALFLGKAAHLVLE
jgi:presenilin-like A22 family membrane protease